MLYGLANKNNKLILRMRTIEAGECYFLKESTLSYSEPVLLLGYYTDAPTFMSTERQHVQSLMVKRVLFSSGEGPSCVALDPHVDVLDLEIMSLRHRPGNRDLKPVASIKG